MDRNQSPESPDFGQNKVTLPKGLSTDNTEFKILHKLASHWNMWVRDRDEKVDKDKFEESLSKVCSYN